MSEIFRTPGEVITGWDCLEELGRIAAPLGRKVMLVTGSRAMKATGILDHALDAIRDAGLKVDIFDRVEPEPDVSTVDAAREQAHNSEANVVIGLGGGSAMDLAKVAAGLFNEPGSTREYLDGRKITTAGLPFIAIPTTAGTGSEATINGVISDRERSIKTSIRDPRFMAMVALVDPSLTVPCPGPVTASAGLDALSQAIESYLSRHATAITESLSIRAVLDLATSVEAAYKDPKDRIARSRAANASLMAGMALNNARLGVIHGVVHPLGVRYNIPHGVACGVMLPVALEYNRDFVPGKYSVLRQLLGGDPVEVTRGLLERMDMPVDFTQYKVDPADFGTIADESMPSGSLKANPREVRREDVIAMLELLCAEEESS